MDTIQKDAVKFAAVVLTGNLCFLLSYFWLERSLYFGACEATIGGILFTLSKISSGLTRELFSSYSIAFLGNATLCITVYILGNLLQIGSIEKQVLLWISVGIVLLARIFRDRKPPRIGKQSDST
jgi:hypothetical protein